MSQGPDHLVHPARLAVTQVEAALDELLVANLWSLSDEVLLEHRRDLERVAARLAAATVAATREIDGRGAASALGAPSTAAWLRSGLRLHPAAARQEVTLARALDGECAATGMALAAGEMSRAHAEQVVAAVAALPRVVPRETRLAGEAFLVEQAGSFAPDTVARLGRHLLHTVDPGLGERLAADEADEVERRAFTVSRRPNGSGDLRGRLDAEGVAFLEAALDPLAAPRPAGGTGPDLRSPARRRADALVELAAAALGSRSGTAEVAGADVAASGGEGSPGRNVTGGDSEPVQVVVTIPLETLESRLDDAARAGLLTRPGEGAAGAAYVRAGELSDGTAISAEAARRLACDAQLVAAVLGGAGQPLDVGRAARAIPRPIRRALVARDRGCAFPGCERPQSWCQAHHIVHWAHGGTTALANLTLLCGHHHRVVHHHGWAVLIGPEGIPFFTPPRWIDPAQIPLTRPWRRALEHLPLRT